MKKYIYSTLLIVISVACKAQTPVFNIGTPNFPPTHPKDSYYKDINGNLDGYDGTYVYTNGNTSLTIILKKKLLSYTGYYYEDLVIGEYQFIKEGVEINNTLANINVNYNNESTNHVITGNFILTGTKWGCPDCAPTEKRLRLSFIDKISHTKAGLDIRKTTLNGVPAIKVHIFSTGDIRVVKDNEPTPAPPTIQLGEYLMIKQ
ncbi:hypothetical protein B6A10_16110 [Flavobacterium sp. L1I52]|uniref:DUF6705 domain-containing protein n=1 Tax=Flavobacterium pokkalii TaxID=1940408 RepID=A0ABR7UWV5_9FLAO|nr:DUF6705 family protein [Flavobacterium pokkalii]MBD0726696.1 hypothetical protein [Flavobacterium pokkalii]